MTYGFINDFLKLSSLGLIFVTSFSAWSSDFDCEAFRTPEQSVEADAKIRIELTEDHLIIRSRARDSNSVNDNFEREISLPRDPGYRSAKAFRLRYGFPHHYYVLSGSMLSGGETLNDGSLGGYVWISEQFSNPRPRYVCFTRSR